MAEYTLITDSTCDLDAGLYEKMGVRVITMHYTVDAREYVDDGTNDSHAFYEMLHNGSSASTMQINAQTYLDIFEEELSKGRDVIYLCFASVLSGSHDNACYAAKECGEKWPERRVVVIDSKSECGGEGLLAYHAAEQKKAGLDFDALVAWIQDAIQRHCHYFTVNDLNHLYRGGRVSAARRSWARWSASNPLCTRIIAASFASARRCAAGYRPCVCSRTRWLQKLPSRKKQLVFINHADCVEDAQRLADDIRSRVNPAEIRILNLGPVIGAHVGPGCLAVFSSGITATGNPGAPLSCAFGSKKARPAGNVSAGLSSVMETGGFAGVGAPRIAFAIRLSDARRWQKLS